MWLLAAAVAVPTVLLAPTALVPLLLALALAALVVVSFLLQFTVDRQQGFIMRVAGSVTGAAMLLGLASLILLARG